MTDPESCTNVNRTAAIDLTQHPDDDNPTILPRLRTKKRKGRCKQKHIGSRIAKYFGNDLYLGTVKRADDFYHVVYDDEDEEDFDEGGLMQVLDLYQKEGNKLEVGKKKAKSVSEKKPKLDKTIVKKQKLSNEYNGSRVAKYFGNKLYLGTVQFTDDFYHVLYDDNDEEDFDHESLLQLLELYQKKGQKMEASAKAAKEKVNKAKQVSSKAASLVGRKKQASKGPTLFEIHNISPNQVESVRKLLPRLYQDSAQNVCEFFLLCHERQLIWQRKRSGQSEVLTKDVKMSNSFYCNVYRELDRGTQYFRYNLIHHRGDAVTLEEVLWDSLCYRLVNKIETFERYGKIPRRDEWEEFVQGTLQPLWNNNEIVFTGAHQTMGRDRYLATINSLWEKDATLLKVLAFNISSANDLKSCYNIVFRVNNVGKFLAWQVLCDLIEAHVVPFTEDDWVQLGPGAINGLKTIFGDSLVKSNELLEKSILLREIQDEVYKTLGLTFPRFIGRGITLKNIEHSLCEFCKYKDDHLTRRFDVNGKGSRSHLDSGKSCHACGAGYSQSSSKLCDLCRTVYCGDCCNEKGKDFEGAWLCSACIGIDVERNK